MPLGRSARGALVQCMAVGGHVGAGDVEVAAHDPELLGGELVHHSPAVLEEGNKELLGQRPPGRGVMEEHLSPVDVVPHPTDVPGAREAVDDRGDRTRGQPEFLCQHARGHRRTPILSDHHPRQGIDIGGVQPVQSREGAHDLDLVVQQALAAGHHVTAATRKPDEFPLSSPHLEVVVADVTDPDGVERVIAGSAAVISTYGVPCSKSEITVYSHGITNITQSMINDSIDHLVCVSSTTVATEAAPGESLLWRKVIGPYLRNKLGRILYDDMQRMEEIVQRSSLDWTIVRPAGLFNATDPTDDYEVAPQRLPGRITSRADLAETLVKEATEPHHSRSIIEVNTRSGTPHFTTFLKEAIGNR